MMPSIRLGLILGAVALQAACASKQIHYHALMPIDQGNVIPAGAAVAPAPFALEILPIGVPAQVDRQELVVRQGGELVILEGERWAATLGDEMRETLGVLLQRRLGAGDVSGLVSPGDIPVLRVKVMVRQFELVSGQYALMDADWNLARADKADVARLLCHSHLRVAAPESYAALVAAQQGLIDALTEQVAGAARIWMVAGANACPRSAE